MMIVFIFCSSNDYLMGSVSLHFSKRRKPPMKYWKRLPTLQKEFNTVFRRFMYVYEYMSLSLFWGPSFIVYRRGYYLWTVFVWWFLHVSFRLFSSIIQGILGYTMKRMLLGNLQRNTWHSHPNFRGLVWESSKFSRICFRKLSETITFQRNSVSNIISRKKQKRSQKKTNYHRFTYIF